ncbi:hypothetical protein [Patulibacter sp. SYSU D01012]|uniref:hypothetical protein n=1 Tax=Patulibacter sp. SYSU D01012 TaxID=2817381 RepID=UPI001B30250D|nr:hypothetical protein [Patulibacter sp. SYSU D01012]
MPQNRRLVPLPTPPQLEVIHAADDTVRAELIALPVPRRPAGAPDADVRAADAPLPAA